MGFDGYLQFRFSLYMLSGYGSLDLFPIGCQRSFKLLFFFFYFSSVWLYPRSLDYLISGAWLLKQCQYVFLLVEWPLVKSDIGWLFPHILCYHCPRIVLRQDTLWIKGFVAGVMGVASQTEKKSCT